FGGTLVSVTVWISEFVVALTSLTETHGVKPVSPTAIGAATVLASPSSAALACALIFGLNGTSGKKSGRPACVSRTSTIAPIFPASSFELQSALLVVSLPAVPMFQFVPFGQYCFEFNSMWKFVDVPCVRLG